MPIPKNAIIYSCTGLTGARLAELCDARPFHPCAPTAATSSGFVPPLKAAPDLMLHSAGGVHGFAFRIDTKLLPGSIVNAAAAERAAEIEEFQGSKPGRAQMRDIKEAIYLQLLQVAFVKSTVVRGWYDSVGELFVIDTSSRSKCDDIIGAISRADEQDEIRFRPLAFGTAPTSAFTHWIETEAPNGFSLDDRAKFGGPDGKTISVRHASVQAPEVTALATSMLCTEMAVTHDDKISFVVNGDLAMKSICILGIDKTDMQTRDMLKEELDDAELVIPAGLIRGAAAAITQAIGGQSGISQ